MVGKLKSNSTNSTSMLWCHVSNWCETSSNTYSRGYRPTRLPIHFQQSNATSLKALEQIRRSYSPRSTREELTNSTTENVAMGTVVQDTPAPSSILPKRPRIVSSELSTHLDLRSLTTSSKRGHRRHRRLSKPEMMRPGED
jgi:hypothetical protein